MKLYKIEITEHPKRTTPYGRADGVVEEYPKGLETAWLDHCHELFGEFRSFFTPSESKLYRSRSSAADKVRIVERWGGKARILVADVGEFVPVAEVAKRRKIAALDQSIAKLIDERMELAGWEVPKR